MSAEFYTTHVRQSQGGVDFVREWIAGCLHPLQRSPEDLEQATPSIEKKQSATSLASLAHQRIIQHDVYVRSHFCTSRKLGNAVPGL